MFEMILGTCPMHRVGITGERRKQSKRIEMFKILIDRRLTWANWDAIFVCSSWYCFLDFLLSWWSCEMRSLQRFSSCSALKRICFDCCSISSMNFRQAWNIWLPTQAHVASGVKRRWKSVSVNISKTRWKMHILEPRIDAERRSRVGRTKTSLITA